MKLNKFVFCNNKEIKDEISKIYDLELIKEENQFSLFKFNRKTNQDNEDIYFLYFNNFNDGFRYLLENYILDKIVLLGFAEIFLNDIDIKNGDVIIPNTFLNKDDNDKLFIEYAIGKSYDLNNFGLILSGILVSGELEEKKEIFADIKDNDTFEILKEISLSDNLDKTVVIKGVLGDFDKNNVAKNIFNIFDLVI